MSHKLLKSQLPRGNSKLAVWCREHNMSASGLAFKIGRSQAQTCVYLREVDARNFQIPPSDVMERIYLVTGGMVTPSDFYNLEFWAKRLDAQAEAAASQVALKAVT